MRLVALGGDRCDGGAALWPMLVGPHRVPGRKMVQSRPRLRSVRSDADGPHPWSTTIPHLHKLMCNLS